MTPREYRPLGDIFGVSVQIPGYYSPSYPWDSIAHSGARWARYDVVWQGVEPFGGGNYDFGEYTHVLKNLRARGMKLIAILGTGNTNYGMASYITAPRGASQIAAYCNYAVAAVSALGTEDVVYEILNESHHRYATAILEYVPLATAAAQEILAVHPNAKLIFAGGLAWNPATDGWSPPQQTAATALTLLSEEAAQAGYSYVSLHPYRHLVPETLTEDIQTLYDADIVTVPLINTEWGYPHGWRVAEPANPANRYNPYVETWTEIVTDAAVASAWAVRMLLTEAALGWPIGSWFRFRDSAVPLDQATGWGLTALDGSPKPAYVALRFLLSRFGDYVYAETLSTGAVWAIRFTAAGRPDLIAAWTMYQFDEGSWPVPAGGAAYDSAGELVATDGDVPLTMHPVYITSAPLPAIEAPTLTFGSPGIVRVQTNPRIPYTIGGAGGFPCAVEFTLTQKPSESALQPSQVYAETREDGSLGIWSYADKAGVYEYTGTATGPDGQTATASIAVTVHAREAQGAPPLVAFDRVAPESPLVGQPVVAVFTYDAAGAGGMASCTALVAGPDSAGVPHSITVDEPEITVVFTPVRGGSYLVTVRVIGALGATEDASMTITIPPSGGTVLDPIPVRAQIRLGREVQDASPVGDPSPVYHVGDTGPNVFVETLGRSGPLDLSLHYVSCLAVFRRGSAPEVHQPCAFAYGQDAPGDVPAPGILVPAPPTDAPGTVTLLLRLTTSDNNIHTVPTELEWTVRA